jgi:hypothetical protein
VLCQAINAKRSPQYFKNPLLEFKAIKAYFRASIKTD